MSTQTRQAPANPHLPAPTFAHRPDVGRRAAALLLLVASVALAWRGGVAGAAGALAAGLLLPWLAPTRRGNGVAPGDGARLGSGRVGAEVMVSQVVPVWSKQLDVTRNAASDGLDKLQHAFNAIAGALHSLGTSMATFAPQVGAGAADGAVGQQAKALAALLAPSQRAFDQRDAAVAELVHCATQLEDLRQLGHQAREIGKHTRLVAFNASIEANRGGGGGTSAGGGTDNPSQHRRSSGAAAVADETRTLAERMATVGANIERTVARLDRTLSPQRLRGEIDDTTPSELQLELDLRAREVLGGLLAALGGALHRAGDIHTTSQKLQRQVDALAGHFQLADRLNQMLGAVATDMHNFARWVAANPYASQSDAADWLAQLERSYTLDEQRSQHHGIVHIQRQSATIAA